MFIISSPGSTASHRRPSINIIWKERHEGREAKRGVMRVWVDRRRDGRMGERMVGGWWERAGRMVEGWWNPSSHILSYPLIHPPIYLPTVLPPSFHNPPTLLPPSSHPPSHPTPIHPPTILSPILLSLPLSTHTLIIPLIIPHIYFASLPSCLSFHIVFIEGLLWDAVDPDDAMMNMAQ